MSTGPNISVFYYAINGRNKYSLGSEVAVVRTTNLVLFTETTNLVHFETML
jgi:hypothetical protein